jgi:hypothetical protein
LNVKLTPAIGLEKQRGSCEHQVISEGLKPTLFSAICGTTEVVPFRTMLRKQGGIEFFRSM